jgi:hypothetical protein
MRTPHVCSNPALIFILPLVRRRINQLGFLRALGQEVGAGASEKTDRLAAGRAKSRRRASRSRAAPQEFGGRGIIPCGFAGLAGPTEG